MKVRGSLCGALILFVIATACGTRHPSQASAPLRLTADEVRSAISEAVTVAEMKPFNPQKIETSDCVAYYMAQPRENGAEKAIRTVLDRFRADGWRDGARATVDGVPQVLLTRGGWSLLVIDYSGPHEGVTDINGIVAIKATKYDCVSSSLELPEDTTDGLLDGSVAERR